MVPFADGTPSTRTNQATGGVAGRRPAIAAAQSEAPKIAVPATIASAPASTARRAFAPFCPPSTPIHGSSLRCSDRAGRHAQFADAHSTRCRWIVHAGSHAPAGGWRGCAKWSGDDRRLREFQ
jgi:hypothetical protein